jgi:transcriptional regulator with XRE-family HTH domain
MSGRQTRLLFDGEALARLRKERGYTVENFARAVNVTLRAVYRWEREGVQPGAAFLLDIARVLEVEPRELIKEIPKEEGK